MCLQEGPEVVTDFRRSRGLQLSEATIQATQDIAPSTLGYFGKEKGAERRSFLWYSWSRKSCNANHDLSKFILFWPS